MASHVERAPAEAIVDAALRPAEVLRVSVVAGSLAQFELAKALVATVSVRQAVVSLGRIVGSVWSVVGQAVLPFRQTPVSVRQAFVRKAVVSVRRRHSAGAQADRRGASQSRGRCATWRPPSARPESGADPDRGTDDRDLGR